jgi:hypothetical protein
VHGIRGADVLDAAWRLSAPRPTASSRSTSTCGCPDWTGSTCLLQAATIAIVGEVPVRRLRRAIPAFPTRSEIWLYLFSALGI